MLKTSVLQSFAKLENNPNCAVAGSETFDNLFQTLGGAISARALVSSLLEKSQDNLKGLEVDSRRCGSCKQVNQVVVYTTSEPELVLVNSSCNNKPTVNIRTNLADSEIQTYIESTIRGNNPEGKDLYLGCPNPCAFFTASASTSLGNNRSLLNLTVHCGPPRNGSILFANYKFTAGLIHKWTCQ